MAQEYLQTALVIGTEIGDREREATEYENLLSFGQYDRAQEYLQGVLVIKTKNWRQKRGSIMLWKPRYCVSVAWATRQG